MLNHVGKSRISNGNLLLAVVGMLVLILGSASVAKAQIYYGSITGTVSDSTGAMVSGATISVTNPANGSTFTATSSDSGVFNVTQLPVGSYEVRVKQAGFKEFVATSVEVHTSSNTEINAKLEVGATTESITVEASNVQVETTSGAVGNVIEGTQVRELPLNGENFMGLVTLTPGVSPADSFNSRDKGLLGGADFSVNGNPYNYNLFLVDGVNNNDVGSGRTILVYPSVDTIAEFKMITNSYGPEYGQATGAIISITTKSGTNQFHGGVFYAGRNDALDANDWFSNFNCGGATNCKKAELRRNDWGYNVSGPVIKNKLFFWWNQEWNREVRGISESACVPTQAERAGDFSADASANAAATVARVGNPGQFTNCGASLPAIPSNLALAGSPYTMDPAKIDPNAQLVFGYYPLPTKTFGAGGNCLKLGDPCTTTGAGQGSNNNWVSSENNRPNWSEWNVRADYDITAKNRVTFRWTQDSWTLPAPAENFGWGDSSFPNINSDWSQPSKSVMAKLTTQVSDTMVNDFEFGYGHNAIVTTLAGTGNGTLNGPELVAAINAAVPTAWPSSLKSAPAMPGFNAGGWGGLSPYGSGQEMWTIAPYANHEDLYALQDNVSKVQGNHVWKFGAYWSTNAKIENNNGGTDQPAFNPANGGINQCPSSKPTCTTANGQPVGVITGNSLANMMVPGQVYAAVGENSQNAVAQVIWHDFEWYIGDTWKARRNLTLSYGFRWSFFREPYAQNNEWTSWSPAYYDPSRPASDACNGIIIVPYTNPCGAAAAQMAALGISLPLSSGTPGNNRALVNNNNHTIAPRLGVAWDPKGDGKTAIRAGVGQFFQREPVGLDEGHSFNAPFVINAQSYRSLGTATALSNPAVSPSYAKDPRAVVPNSWQWNVSIQRELLRNMTLQAGYVGNTGIHLTSGYMINAIPNADWVQAAFLSGGSQNALRPAGHFGTIGEFQREGHASYNALQLLYKWQMGNFSTFQAAYTYSHSLANVELNNSSGSPVNEQAVTDNSNFKLDKGNTLINRPNIFVFNEVYYLPKFEKKASYVRQTIGGWELNSIITISSGSSLTVFSSGASAYQPSALKDLSGNTIGPCSATDMANGTCVVGPNIGALNSLQGSGLNNNNRPDRASGVNCNAGENGRNILNANAFTLIGYSIGSVGTAGRGVCSGPTYHNFDMQLAKNWNFGERYRLKFAMDFFNIFNHANFYNPPGSPNYNANGLICGSIVPGNGTVANPDHYLPCSATNNVVSKIGGNPTAGFGQSTSVHPGRELQYSLRFYF